MSHAIPEFTTSIVDEGFGPEDADTKELYNEVGAFAKQGQPIIIFGPTGAGKEFLTRHYYNTLIKAEFYKLYKENWPSNYEEIKRKYSACYSEESLNIFLTSIRAGVFQSINSATIYPDLAESILFGHEAHSFTGAEKASPGLLESIKYGVLFMDEIGDLSKDLQAKLLRAVDSEIHEGRRIAGKIDYSLKDIIIISATNQPRDKIRKDFYYKLGIDVEIKGIDKRPKDVRKSIPHFISKAVGKRKDYAAVINMFGIRGLKDIKKLSETDEVKNFAQELGGLVTDEILMQKWPGNFRALRNALEASIFRIESPYDTRTFSQEFRNYLHSYIAQYSTDIVKTSVVVEKSVPDAIFPSHYPEKDNRILEKIDQEKSFQDMDDFEKKVLAVFLSSTYKTGFRRRDLEEYYKKHGIIKHTSPSHIRGKINKLLTIKILDKTGKSKRTRYHLTKSFLDQINVKSDDIFSVPSANNKWENRSDEINALGKVLLTTERVYIQAPTRYGKSAFIAMFCKAFEKHYNFYYYPLGEAGVKKMFEDSLRLLRHRNIVSGSKELLEEPVSNFHPFLEEIFKSKEGAKPVLILDNAHYISDPDGISTIAELAKKWQEVILILIGEKMDNAFQEDFHEFPLGPWGKQA